MAENTRIEVLHLNWDKTNRDERWEITQPTGAFPEKQVEAEKAARAALATGKYDLVATRNTGLVIANDAKTLEVAYFWSNSIDSAWYENGEGYWDAEREGTRSTSVGDIIKLTRNQRDTVRVTWHLVSNFGFNRIISATRQPPTPSALDDDRIEYEERRLAACYPELYSW